MGGSPGRIDSAPSWQSDKVDQSAPPLQTPYTPIQYGGTMGWQPQQQQAAPVAPEQAPQQGKSPQSGGRFRHQRARGGDYQSDDAMNRMRTDRMNFGGGSMGDLQGILQGHPMYDQFSTAMGGKSPQSGNPYGGMR